jgi:excisionase family DNA binding protein
MSTSEKPGQLRTVGEAALELRCSRASVYRAVESGALEAWRLGENGQLRISRESLDRFLIPASKRPAQWELP